jgi:hypothetical protein
MAARPLRDFPLRANIAKEIYSPLPIVPAHLVEGAASAAATVAGGVIAEFSNALAGCDAAALRDLFFREQSYWRDSLAMTYHLRTFRDDNVIVHALLELNSKRRIRGASIIPGSPSLLSPSPTLVRGKQLQLFDQSLPFPKHEHT